MFESHPATNCEILIACLMGVVVFVVVASICWWREKKKWENRKKRRQGKRPVRKNVTIHRNDKAGSGTRPSPEKENSERTDEHGV